MEDRSLEARQRPLLLLIATLLAGWTLWSTQILPRLPRLTGMEHLAQSIGVRLLLWGLPCAVYLWRTHRRRALRGLRLGLPPTPVAWLVAFVITALASLAVSVDVARQLDWPLSEVWVRCLERLPGGFPTSELFEELVFRSVLLSELLLLWCEGRRPDLTQAQARVRAWMANLAASLVFVGMHWPWWLYTIGIGETFFRLSAGVFLISLVLGMVFIGSRSVWPCVVLHWINNTLSSMTGGA